MTTNITLFTMNVGDIRSGQQADRRHSTRTREANLAGGRWLSTRLRAWRMARRDIRTTLVLPVGFALLAFALISVSRGQSRLHHSEPSDHIGGWGEIWHRRCGGSSHIGAAVAFSAC
jgi:hypothetical protein